MILMLVLGPGLVDMGCTSQSDGTSGRGAAAKRPVPVKAEPVRRGSFTISLRYPGELRARRSVEVAAEVSGRIQLVAVRMGERVKPRQLLVRIDDTQIRSQLEEARAAVQVARSSLRRAEVEDANTATELARKLPLAKRELITKQEMDNVRSRRDTAAASLSVARAQVSQAEARLSLLAKQLKDTRIRASFGGWIQTRHLDPGAVVNPGTAVLRLVQANPIVASFQLGERHIGEVRRRMASGTVAVQLAVDAYPDQVFTGVIARVAPALDTASRTVAVEAELDNEDGRLMPGMFCRVELNLGTRRDALLAPLRALIEQTAASSTGSGRTAGSQEARLYVVKDGTARLTRVRLGAEDAERVEVLAGLDEGQLVVVEGQDGLVNGARVEVVQAGGGGPR